MDKRFILDEIKRTAEANGGVALGINRFEQETGIKKSDWLGKYWARWGDAVREADFAPNKMVSAYNEDAVIDKFIDLMRELGKFPVSEEVNLKARTSPNFPWHNTFSRHFGSKQKFAAKIISYCAGRSGYEDVIALCIPIAQPQEVPSEDATESEAATSFVYLMKSGKYYKIGRSNAAGRREYELAIQMPEKLTTVHTIQTDDPAGIEKYWHARFNEKHKNGEWFDLSGSDIRAFKRRKFM